MKCKECQSNISLVTAEGDSTVHLDLVFENQYLESGVISSK